MRYIIAAIVASLNELLAPIIGRFNSFMMELNFKEHHGIGNQAYSTATNFHRLKDYFKFELGINLAEGTIDTPLMLGTEIEKLYSKDWGN